MDDEQDFQTRTRWLIGDEAAERLRRSRVAIFGVGGVGSYAAEALARCGVGSITMVDHDVITRSNVNRQIHALHSTLGRLKAEVMGERIEDINPDAQVRLWPLFFNGSVPDGWTWEYDYILDAVDTVTAKLQIVLAAKRHGIPVISAMGAGNRLDPAGFEITDIFKTSGCPLAKVMRSLLRKHDITSLKVVFSRESPRIGPNIGSIAFVPAAAGLMMAGAVVQDLTR